MTVELDGGGRWQRLQPRERALIIIFGLIALLAVVYLLLLSGGGEEPEALPTSRPRSRGTATPAPSATPTPGPTGIPQTDEVFEGKDPFRPLVGAAGGGDGAPAPGGTPSSGGPSGGDGQRVTLIDVSGSGDDRTATVQVNGTEYTVQAGDTFAGSYRVMSLTSTCGTFLFGDEQFTLCEGQEVLK